MFGTLGVVLLKKDTKIIWQLIAPLAYWTLKFLKSLKASFCRKTDSGYPSFYALDEPIEQFSKLQWVSVT